jgi:hypothetical protein
MGNQDDRNSLRTMKSFPNSPGTDAAAAHRHGLDSEPAGGTSAAPGLPEHESHQAPAGGSETTALEVFEDLRRRNERRARFARPQPDDREDRRRLDRVSQRGRERRSRRVG